MKNNTFQIGDIAILQNKPIYDRGRVFNGPFTIRINGIYPENKDKQINFTIIDGEPGSIGITNSCMETEIIRIDQSTP